MRKLFYIANIRFPTERAHGIQVAHMCASFARQMRRYDADMTQMNADADTAVTLLVPDRETFSEDPFEYYGIERNFTIEKIPVPDIVRFGRVGFFIESLVFAWRVARRIHKTVDIRCPQSLWTPDVYIYTREELSLLFLPRRNAFYEAHQLRRGFFFRFLIKRAKGIVAISQGLKDALVSFGIPAERILVAHDGYDEKQFAERISREEARKRLGLLQNGRIAMYIGGLEAWKGAETLCKAAAFLEGDDIKVVVMGGTAEEKEKFEQKYPLVTFLDSRPYAELPISQQAADILVVPNSGEYEISKSFTSPLKLFAHMASGVAFCAARVPAIEEVVTWEQAFPFAPDDPANLSRVIKRALSSEFLSRRLSKAAAAEKRARDFTWDKRAENVLGYIRWLGEKKSS